MAEAPIRLAGIRCRSNRPPMTVSVWRTLALFLLLASSPSAAQPRAALDGLAAPEDSELQTLIQEINKDGRLDSRELDELVAAVAAADEQAARWVSSSNEGSLSVADAPPWLIDSQCPWVIANPLTLHAARAAALEQRYQAALEWLDLREAMATRLEAESPANGESLALFYRAVSFHQLVKLDKAVASAEALLALPSEATAMRHRHTARLIARDAQGVDEKSLGYVAKLMGDSRRRLALGRSGKVERELQQDIIDRLDKTIEDIEEQQRKQQQQQQQAQGGSPSQGATPMEDSLPGEMRGDGDVDDRRVAAGGDWGSLPPAERERVTQQIIRDFPQHYRQLIEQYFRSLADPEAEEPAPPRSEAADR